MILNHPLLGPRDLSEFVYLGDACLINRPDWQADDALNQFIDYGHTRDNSGGPAPRTLVSRTGRPCLAGGDAKHRHARDHIGGACPRRGADRRAVEMSQKNRLDGGLIDRSETYSFRFDSQHYKGHKGDTLASALLANGVRLMGRSFKYHRLAWGDDRRIGRAERDCSTSRATAPAASRTRVATVAGGLTTGMQATETQNRWPSLSLDRSAR